MELPTVDQLVQVFIDNNWKGLTNSIGCSKTYVSKGFCCAIPAMIKFSGKELDFDYDYGYGLYGQVKDIYNINYEDVYRGFDLKLRENNVQELTCDLRNALEELGIMA
jgi:hypothetical protein